jgi:hypothetical protein
MVNCKYAFDSADMLSGYPMPMADLLIDAASGHRIISFMDENAGYNQIFMAEEDILKTALDALDMLACMSGLS